MSAWVYMLRLRSGTLYVGWTSDLSRRVDEHMKGEGGRTTRLDPPKRLAYAEKLMDVESAKEREAQLKHWTRAKKEALIAGDMKRLHTLACRKVK